MANATRPSDFQLQHQTFVKSKPAAPKGTPPGQDSQSSEPAGMQGLSSGQGYDFLNS